MSIVLGKCYSRGSTVDSMKLKEMQAALSQALEDARQRQAQVSALLRGSRVILESRDFKEAAPSIFDACKTLLGASGGYISLLTEDEPRSQVVFQTQVTCLAR